MMVGGRSVFIRPQPFGPLALNPVLWLDASDASTLFQDSALTTPAVADADPVGGWFNKSTGAATHATQATGTKRGSLKTAIINGLNVVRFDGTDDFLEANALSSSFTGSDMPFTLLMAFKKITNVGTDGLLYLSSSSSGTPLHGVRTNAAASYDSVRRDDAAVLSLRTGGTPDTSPHVLTVAFSGTAVTATLDGTTIINNLAHDVGTITLNRLTVGMGRTNVETDPANVDLGELLLSASALSAGTIATGVIYLRTKWGI